MSTLKKCKVVLLPTNQKLLERGQIYSLFNRLNICTSRVGPILWDDWNHADKHFAQHLYITSDDEIKEGDWFLSDERDSLSDNNGLPLWKLEKCEKIINDWIFAEGRPDEGLNTNWCKKIIATTDSSLKLIESRTSTLRNLTIDYLLPKPSQSFIKKYLESYNKGNIITDVLVEYEYKGCCGAINTSCFERNHCAENEIQLKVNSKDNTVTIKKVKDSWNREEVIALLKSISYTEFQKLPDWIKENL